MDDSEVPIHTDTKRRRRGRVMEKKTRYMKFCIKRFTHPPGQKQDATVHVDKVAEGVNIGAGHTVPSTVVQSDASGQRQRHQQIGYGKVYGVDHRG